MATREECSDAITRLLLTLPSLPYGWGEATTEARADMWSLVLRDLSLTELRRACASWTTGEHCGRMPAPGELLRLARPPATDADLGAAGRSAWQQVQRVRHRYREHTGRGYQWRSERHEAAFRAEIGPVACAALDCVGGILAVERAGFMPDEGRELSGLESRFVADFRTIAKRAGPDIDRPQVEARSVRAIAEDADLAPDLARRLAEHVNRSEVSRG